MKFTLDGKDYGFDFDTLTLDEAEVLEDYARLGPRDFMDALKEIKPRAIRALVYIAKRRAGEDVRWGDLGSLDLLELAKAILDANRDQLPAAPAVVAGEGEALRGAVSRDDVREAEGLPRIDGPTEKLKKARKPRARTAMSAAFEADPEPAAG